MTDAKYEEEIQEKGLTAPRVTPEHLESVIVSEQYHVFTGTTFTACLLTLKNGYTVLGESACASPENFNAELGRKIARDNAKNKIWQLEGYLLKNMLNTSQEDKLASLLVNAVTAFDAPKSTSYGEGMKQVIIGIGKDECATICLHEDGLKYLGL